MKQEHSVSRKKMFIFKPLIFIFCIGLGLLLILAFYSFASNDLFYLHDKKVTLRINGTYKVDISANYDIEDLELYSENPDIATITSDGSISAHALGKTKIIVRSKARLFEKKIDVDVSNFTVYSVVFEEDNVNLDVEDEYFLTPILNGDIDLKSNLDWKSSDDNVVTVSSTGRVKALNGGKAVITATDKYTGLSGTLTVQVDGGGEKVEQVAVVEEAADEEMTEYIAIENISLNTNHLNMYVGTTRKISAVINPSDATDKNLVYTSSDSSIATVDNNGMVTARKTGICNVFVSSSDGSINIPMVIEVMGKKTDVQSLTLSEKKVHLDIDESYLIVPTITPENASNKAVIYVSSDESVASVDSGGKVKAKKNGTTTIVAVSKDGRKNASLIVEVSNTKISKNKIASATIDNFNSTMLVGKKNNMTINIVNDKGEPVPFNLTSSDNEVATVSQKGEVEAKTPGIINLDIETIDGSYHVSRIITILPGKINAEMVYINKKSLQLVTGSSYKLVATVLPELTSDKKIIWSSNNNGVATVDKDGNIKAVGVGTAIITAKVRNSGVSRTVKVAVVNKQQIIDVRKQRLVPYYTNFRIYDKGTTNSRAMQNFAIAGAETNNQIIYASFVDRSNIRKGVKVTSKLTKEIMRTVIVKIPSKQINTPNSNKREYMYLNNSGHGQSFDLDSNNNFIWTNGGGYTYVNKNGVYWGGNRQLVRVKFKKNQLNSAFSANRTITIHDSANVIYNNPELTLNWNENLAAVRHDNQVSIYKATDFINGKLTLLYSFNLANKASDGTSASRQGHAVANGYYYQYRGYVGTKLYIEVYNYIGELQYTYIFNPKLTNQEAEGLKIYNNHVYIGITASCPKCSGRVNNIYYFK